MTTEINVCKMLSTMLAIIMINFYVGATEINVFLFMGQSNMAGADAFLPDDFVQTESDKNALFTYAPGPGDITSPYYYKWGDIRGTGDIGKLTHGPEMGFARILYSTGMRHIAIIKVAANIPTTEKIWLWGSDEKYYQTMTKFFNDRLAELTQKGYTYKVRGFVWHQGIDDGFHEERSAQYEKNLKALIARLRKDYATPQTPFILARSANSTMTTPAYMARVREAQVRIGETEPYVGWINVDDQPNVNVHHFTSTGQLVLGRRFAATWLKLSYKTQSNEWEIKPVSILADFDGDKLTDFAIYTPKNGLWDIKLSMVEYQTCIISNFGGIDWTPVLADFDGDSKADPTIFCSKNKSWQTMLSQYNWKIFLIENN